MKSARAPLIIAQVLLAIAATAILPLSAHGEEAASGHYLPGTTADFIDMLPDRDSLTLVYANAFTYYHGSAGASREVEFGGEIVANAKATIYADTSLFLLQTAWKLLGGQYGGAIVVPYFWMEVKGNVALAKFSGFGPEVRDTANGFSDIQLIPLMFGWKYGDFKWETRFSIFAPTGGFEAGHLAYAYQIGNFDLAAEVKWLPEIDVTHRLSGDIVWFKIGLSYAQRPENPVSAM